jgi:hypothetical protein
LDPQLATPPPPLHRNRCAPFVSIANIPADSTVYNNQIRMYPPCAFPATIRANRHTIRKKCFVSNN